MTQIQGVSALEKKARNMAEDLMNFISGSNGWQPGMWKSIIAAVEIVGDDAREASPYAALIYQRYILIAHAYLIKFPNHMQRRGLVARIESDLRSLAHYREQMDVRAFDVHEMLTLEAADKDIKKSLELIDR
jgi:hypothetical protein